MLVGPTDRVPIIYDGTNVELLSRFCRDASQTSSLLNPKTAKIWMLAVAGVVIAAVVIFFRKPAEERAAETKPVVKSPPLVLRRDVAASVDQTVLDEVGPKEVAVPEVTAPSPTEATFTFDQAANPSPAVTLQEGKIAASSAEPVAQPNPTMETVNRNQGFIPPSVAALPDDWERRGSSTWPRGTW